MKKSLLILTVLVLMVSLVRSQNNAEQYDPKNLPILSEQEMQWLSNLPELTLPEELTGPNAPLLPTSVYNSDLPYWRPVFAQESYECGQASSVGLGFSYQINRMRNASGELEENQYPPYFSYNWANEGNAWHGVSYFHTFEVLKFVGTPTVEEYGGMTAGGAERWMNGYDMYYDAMKNRITEAYQIDCSTEEGILTLKHWIHNHLEGAEDGGVANFYANAPGASLTLPSGTPEAGMYVVTGWGGANHGMTICCYHDSICWDYNSDGQYTNDVDINNDGTVDVRDWEIGGFRFANTYSGGPNFGNDGFCYMMYKSLADPSGNGGIWNNAVHVQYAKADMEPQLTAKVTLKHKCRNEVRVRVGVSADPGASYPDFILGFPAFDFQGGCMFMQGGYGVEEKKTIEFGLDLTPLLNFIGSGVEAKYFLLVDNIDADLIYEGELIDFSIIDYTDGIEEIAYPETNIVLDYGLNSYAVTHTINFDQPSISDETLPDATVYSPYNFQLSATGGAPPYFWEHDMNYTEENYLETFPMVLDEQLNPSNNDDGYATKNLDFTFPFYDKEYNQIRVYVDGYIRFDPYLDYWPYQAYDFLKFTKNIFIAPLMADLKIIPADNEGIWYQGSSTHAIFRWKVSSSSGLGDYNFAVKLTHTGDIFYYFGINDPMPEDWFSALSKGDNKYYQFTAVSGHPEIGQNYVCELQHSSIPEGFTVTRNGNLTGITYDALEDFPIKFKVTDENNITSNKTLTLSTDGTAFLVIDDFSVYSEGDELIEYGEMALLSFDIKNIGDETVADGFMEVSCDDPYITLTDGEEDLGDFGPGEIKTFNYAITFDVANNVPDSYNFSLPVIISSSSGNDWSSTLDLEAFAPELAVGAIFINDGGNGQIDPGETISMDMNINNNGGAAIENVVCLLSTEDPYVTLNSDEDIVALIEPNSTGSVNFNFDVSIEVTLGHILEFNLHMEGENEYMHDATFFLIVGQNVENFESGGFLAYPWEFGGDTNWVIDESVVYEGNYSSRSGDINDDENSEMILNVCVLNNSEISFYAKVSSEPTYDFLKFYIDGAQYGSWDGEMDWSLQTYPISAGLHTLKWAFEKDYSVSTGSDCGWIDFITFPVFGDPNPQMTMDPESFYFGIEEGTVMQDSIIMENTGIGPITYHVAAVDEFGEPVNWITYDPEMGGINAGEEETIQLEFSAVDLPIGTYTANIIITDHMETDHEIPVTMDVLVDINNIIINDNNIYPNPFSNHVTFDLLLPEDEIISMSIYDPFGKQIKNVVDQEMRPAGKIKLFWDGTNNDFVPVENGIYYYQCRIGEKYFTGKLIKIN